VSQPTPQPSGPSPQAQPGAPVSVPIGALLQALHDKYGAQLRMIIQENAELQAGIEQQASELAYLRSVVAAQQDDTTDSQGTDGHQGLPPGALSADLLG
jgi:hypothetical protein